MIDDWDYWEADDDLDEDYSYEMERQKKVDEEEQKKVDEEEQENEK